MQSLWSRSKQPLHESWSASNIQPLESSPPSPRLSQTHVKGKLTSSHSDDLQQIPNNTVPRTVSQNQFDITNEPQQAEFGHSSASVTPTRRSFFGINFGKSSASQQSSLSKSAISTSPESTRTRKDKRSKARLETSPKHSSSPELSNTQIKVLNFSALSVEQLLQPTKIDHDNLRPLQVAVCNGDANALREKLHRKKGAGDRGNALLLAVELCNSELVQILLGIGSTSGGHADPNTTNDKGRSPLILAASHAHAGIICDIVSAGGNINHRDILGCTALHYAIAADSVDCVKLLLSQGADMDFIDRSGMLHVIKLLIEKGADPSSLDSKGLLPEDYALDSDENCARAIEHTSIESNGTGSHMHSPASRDSPHSSTTSGGQRDPHFATAGYGQGSTISLRMKSLPTVPEDAYVSSYEAYSSTVLQPLEDKPDQSQNNSISPELPELLGTLPTTSPQHAIQDQLNVDTSISPENIIVKLSHDIDSESESIITSGTSEPVEMDFDDFREIELPSRQTSPQPEISNDSNVDSKKGPPSKIPSKSEGFHSDIEHAGGEPTISSLWNASSHTSISPTHHASVSEKAHITSQANGLDTRSRSQLPVKYITNTNGYSPSIQKSRHGSQVSMCSITSRCITSGPTSPKRPPTSPTFNTTANGYTPTTPVNKQYTDKILAPKSQQRISSAYSISSNSIFEPKISDYKSSALQRGNFLSAKALFEPQSCSQISIDDSQYDIQEDQEIQAVKVREDALAPLESNVGSYEPSATGKSLAKKLFFESSAKYDEHGPIATLSNEASINASPLHTNNINSLKCTDNAALLSSEQGNTTSLQWCQELSRAREKASFLESENTHYKDVVAKRDSQIYTLLQQLKHATSSDELNKVKLHSRDNSENHTEFSKLAISPDIIKYYENEVKLLCQKIDEEKQLRGLQLSDQKRILDRVAELESHLAEHSSSIFDPKESKAKYKFDGTDTPLASQEEINRLKQQLDESIAQCKEYKEELNSCESHMLALDDELQIQEKNYNDVVKEYSAYKAQCSLDIKQCTQKLDDSTQEHDRVKIHSMQDQIEKLSLSLKESEEKLLFSQNQLAQRTAQVKELEDACANECRRFSESSPAHRLSDSSGEVVEAYIEPSNSQFRASSTSKKAYIASTSLLLPSSQISGILQKSKEVDQQSKSHNSQLEVVQKEKSQHPDENKNHSVDASDKLGLLYTAMEDNAKEIERIFDEIMHQSESILNHYSCNGGTVTTPIRAAHTVSGVTAEDRVMERMRFHIKDLSLLKSLQESIKIEQKSNQTRYQEKTKSLINENQILKNEVCSLTMVVASVDTDKTVIVNSHKMDSEKYQDEIAQLTKRIEQYEARQVELKECIEHGKRHTIILEKSHATTVAELKREISHLMQSLSLERDGIQRTCDLQDKLGAYRETCQVLETVNTSSYQNGRLSSETHITDLDISPCPSSRSLSSLMSNHMGLYNRQKSLPELSLGDPTRQVLGPHVSQQKAEILDVHCRDLKEKQNKLLIAQSELHFPKKTPDRLHTESIDKDDMYRIETPHYNLTKLNIYAIQKENSDLRAKLRHSKQMHSELRKKCEQLEIVQTTTDQQVETNSALFIQAQIRTKSIQDETCSALEMLESITFTMAEIVTSWTSSLQQRNLPKNILLNNYDLSLENLITVINCGKNVYGKAAQDLKERIEDLVSDCNSNISSLELLLTEISKTDLSIEPRLLDLLYKLIGTQKENFVGEIEAFGIIGKYIHSMSQLVSGHAECVRNLAHSSLTSQKEHSASITAELNRKIAQLSQKNINITQQNETRVTELELMITKLQHDQYLFVEKTATTASPLVSVPDVQRNHNSTKLLSPSRPNIPSKLFITTNPLSLESESKLESKSDSDSSSSSDSNNRTIKEINPQKEKHATSQNPKKADTIETLTKTLLEYEIKIRDQLQELSELQSENATYKSTMINRLDQDSVVNQRIQYLEKQIDILSTSKASNEVTIRRLNSEIVTLSTEKNKLQEQSQHHIEAEMTISKLSSRVSDLEGTHARLKTENSRALQLRDEEHTQLLHCLDTKRKLSEDLQSRLEKAAYETAKKLSESKVLHIEKVTGMSEKLHFLEDEVISLQEKLSLSKGELASQLNSMASFRKKMDQDINAEAKCRDDAKQQFLNTISEMEEQQISLKEEVVLATSRISTLQRQVSGLEAKLRAKEANVSQLTKDLSLLQDEKLQEKAEDFDLRLQIQQMSIERGQILKESQNVVKHNASLSARIKTLEADMVNTVAKSYVNIDTQPTQLSLEPSTVTPLQSSAAPDVAPPISKERVRGVKLLLGDERSKRLTSEGESHRLLQQYEAALEKLQKEHSKVCLEFSVERSAFREIKRSLDESHEREARETRYTLQQENAIRSLQLSLKASQKKNALDSERLKKKFEKQAAKVVESYDARMSERRDLEKCRAQNDQEIHVAFERQLQALQDEIMCLRKELAHEVRKQHR
ncbi:hypothetical protein BASA62_009252 [Batrachochytrium salamandrivorans]|nr:hypothetical protein BASA62_009252 [Batrachochytrium salamandrivorans]